MLESAPPPLSPDQYGDTGTIASFTGLSETYLRQLRVKGGGPPFSKVSTKAVRYRVGDVISWMQSKTVTSTSELEAA